MCASPSRADAAAHPSAAAIAQAGNGHGAAPCMACHGSRGGGQVSSGFPRLAGLNQAYLLKQLNDYASGARDNTIMTPVARTLTATEREALAKYYSVMPVPAAVIKAGANPSGADAPGGQLALRGRWSKQVPACVQCHGPHGMGVGQHFPPLAGQSAAYIASQLQAWQNGTRHNDPLQLMQHVASALDSADIKQVSAWFATQPVGAIKGTP
ncbi:c-type cytochrome [Oleiagrimonas sp.]|uniref:c-type cytochrome n=1 Tax=Oleiagrimonas sp. TaxID=2010330 RepID=UPI0031BA6779